MFKGLFTVVTLFCVTFGAASASACLQAKPNYSYELSGKITLQENGVTYTDCSVADGYLTLKDNEVFRLQSLVIECNERMLGHNTAYLTLKDGKVNSEQEGFEGTYDSHNLKVKVAKSDADGTFEEVDQIFFSEKCDAVAIDVKIKKAGKVTYNGHFLGQLALKKRSH